MVIDHKTETSEWTSVRKVNIMAVRSALIHNPSLVDCHHGSGAIRHIKYMGGNTFMIFADYQKDEIQHIVKEWAEVCYSPWFATFKVDKETDACSCDVTFYKVTHTPRPGTQKVRICLNGNSLEFHWDDGNVWVQTTNGKLRDAFERTFQDLALEHPMQQVLKD